MNQIEFNFGETAGRCAPRRVVTLENATGIDLANDAALARAWAKANRVPGGAKAFLKNKNAAQRRTVRREPLRATEASSRSGCVPAEPYPAADDLKGTPP